LPLLQRGTIKKKKDQGGKREKEEVPADLPTPKIFVNQVFFRKSTKKKKEKKKGTPKGKKRGGRAEFFL